MSITAKAESLTSTITDAIANLAADTDGAKQDATFRTWLTTMSRFHAYSFGNQLLIATQCPTARRVAGFQAWKGLGRCVRKGEKAIYILAPMVRREKDDDAKGESTRRLLGFRAATVFDIAQTDGDALPEAPCHDTTNGGEDLLPRLEIATASYGIALVYKTLTSGAQGYSKGGVIEIHAEQTTAAKCGTLAHELAHELLHKVDRSQGTRQRELEAEAVAFAVLTHYGMQPQSRFYLASYGITGDMLTASMQTIAATARQIIERIEGQTEGQEADAEASPLLLAA